MKFYTASGFILPNIRGKIRVKKEGPRGIVRNGSREGGGWMTFF